MPDSAKPERSQNNETPTNAIRLNKAIADTGYCARRKADELIQAGKVQVNGQTVNEMGLRIDPANDVISINGQPLTSAAKAYLLFNKPTGYVTSRRGGRTGKSIYELIPPAQHSVDPAGRLDQDSSGALILSNDGDFLYKITHPKFHLPKIYEITLDRSLTPEEIDQLRHGIHLMPEDKFAVMKQVIADEKNPKRYQVELITGYNRQIRRSLTAVRARVLTLHRVSFGPISLGNLKPGQARPLTAEEQVQLLTNFYP